MEGPYWDPNTRQTHHGSASGACGLRQSRDAQTMCQAGHARHPHHVDYVTSAITRPLVKAWEAVSPVEWCRALDCGAIFRYADIAYILADEPRKLHARGSAFVESAAAYGIPFEGGSLDILRSGGGVESLSLSVGRCFTPTPALKSWGWRWMPRAVPMLLAITAIATAATGVRF